MQKIIIKIEDNEKDSVKVTINKKDNNLTDHEKRAGIVIQNAIEYNLDHNFGLDENVDC